MLTIGAIAILAAILALLNPASQYVEKQGVEQVKILLSARPVAQVLADPHLSAQVRDRLQLAQEARAYGEQHLGLRHTDNFGRYVDLGSRNAVTWVVSGAEKTKLVPYTWWFPVVGTVPYKGYFDKGEALSEKASLERQDLDASVRGVAAYSLLGILPDPLTSPLVRYRPAVLSNIVIHELTHATVFIPGNAAFNEGMATFVGDEGSVRFLSQKYGPDAPETRYARDARVDDAVFTQFVQDLLARLRTLYGSALARDEKLVRRQAIFADAKAQFAHLPFKTDYYAGFEKADLNNAYLLQYATYFADLGRFEKVFHRLGDDMPRYIAFFKEMARQSDPQGATDRWLAGQATGSAVPRR